MLNIYWRAIYKDGTFLSQYNGKEEHKYADIDRSKLKYFDLLETGNKNPLIRYYFDSPDKKLIYRKRNFLKSTGERSEIYLIGWQCGKVQSISVLFPDKSIHVIDKWQDNAIFGKPLVHKQEGEDWE
jgi:hypothetical protein